MVVTTAIATALGLALGLLVRPGRFLDAGLVRAAMASEVPAAVEAPAAPALGQLPELVIGLLPTNPLASMVGGEMLQVILFAAVVGMAVDVLTVLAGLAIVMGAFLVLVALAGRMSPARFLAAARAWRPMSAQAPMPIDLAVPPMNDWE